MDELKCLKCNGEIEYDDCYDTECDCNYVIRSYTGHCIECGEKFLWEELYEFKKINDLRIQ